MKRDGTPSNWEQIMMPDGTIARKYADGTIRNERGYPVPGSKINNTGHEITHENAREYQASAIAKKREVMARAANREVQPELIAEFGEYAHVAERAINLQRIATTPEAGKAAVMAHDALVRDTGMSEKIEKQGERSDDNYLRDVLADLADIARAIQAPLHDTIEGEVTSTE
jgi:hypothetical protein